MDPGVRDENDPDISFRVIRDAEAGEGAVDDEDDIEELRKSLKEIVQDETVKPKLQCLTVDPSFSMVTVQSEDSGIVWETVSSRCSTPWASEGSTTSEAYSLDGSGAQGKIIIIMDEDKIVRKRKKTRGKPGERLKRPSSRNFPGGNERPFMTQVAVPNVRPDSSGENGEPVDPRKDKEQQLFNLVSEGYEILNIIVPSKLPTVDEEESSEMADNLSYLEESLTIKKVEQSLPDVTEEKEDEETRVLQAEEETPQNVETKAIHKDRTSDMDYFEKFTLFDPHIPDNHTNGMVEEAEMQILQTVETEEKKVEPTGGVPTSEDPFASVGDDNIVSEHLDEVFYGGLDDADDSTFNRQEQDAEDQNGTEVIGTSLKKSGSALFGSQETILTPIFLSSGPPKIIDPVLLEEPSAMSFHYMDLYEESVGERRKEEDASDVESIASEKSFHRRLSDSDDASGYFEKFILKDETPAVDSEPIEDDLGGGSQIWAQSVFELTGCLTRVEEEDDTMEDVASTKQSFGLINHEPSKQTENTEISQDIIKLPQPVTLKEEIFSLDQLEKPLEEKLTLTPIQGEKLPDKVQIDIEPIRTDEEEAIGKEIVHNKTEEQSRTSDVTIMCQEIHTKESAPETIPEEEAEVIAREIVPDKETQNKDPESKTVIAHELSTPQIEESTFSPLPKCTEEWQDLHETASMTKIHEEESLAEIQEHESVQLKDEVQVDNRTTEESQKEIKESVLENESTILEESSEDYGNSMNDEETDSLQASPSPEQIMDFENVLVNDNVYEDNIDRPIRKSGVFPRKGRPLLRLSPLIPIEDVEEEEEPKEKSQPQVLEENVLSPLKSFLPQVDLSEFGKDNPESDQTKEMAEELGYEIITKEEVGESEDDGFQKDRQTPDFNLTPINGRELPIDKLLENEYEIVEGTGDVELTQREKAQASDAFCLVCQKTILTTEQPFGEHKDHETSTLDEAYEDIKGKLGDLIAMLQERSENIEDIVSELEMAYDLVEDHFKECEKSLDSQNEEMMKLLLDQYNEMSHKMEEEKKVKLEQLYDQIVGFQENIDMAKEALEKCKKDMEELDQSTFVSSSNDINERLNAALESSLSHELTPSAFPMFEDYSKSPVACGRKELKGISIPQKPHLQGQEPNSATGTSVTVYWKVNEGDVIDCFQVYCMEEPHGVVLEEYRVTVKESYCALEDLDPDKSYKVWVMAVNYAGCSLPSEKLSYTTAPSVPTIDTERCTVCWDSAVIRWSPVNHDTAESFTLEYCRQYACEGEGLRSISGIRRCEQKVLLHPNENYLFYIKAVNTAGASEQSEATLVSTRCTRFHLLKHTASPALEVSHDLTAVHWRDERACAVQCPAVLGECLPPRGCYYWETSVEESQAYRIGVAYSTTASDSPIGENNTSWCLHCIPRGGSCHLELLHDSRQMDAFVTKVPGRVGTLLDFSRDRLSFFNAQTGQLLGSCQHRFEQPCHPALALVKPGGLALQPVVAVPEFVKHC